MLIFKKTLFKASGNRFVQNILEFNAQASQYLMGIGSGGDVASSGEQAIFHVLRSRGKPPYCIFDVGANKGLFLQLILDNLQTDEYDIHCFEPGHETFRILSESSRKDLRIKLNNICIGKETGDALLYSDFEGSGFASLTKRRLDHIGVDLDKSEKVNITTIDHYCTEHHIDRISLLKLDIEGHEFDALIGARQMFDKKAIDIATFEFGGCNIDTRTFFQDFWYFMREIDMSIFRITPSGYLHPISSYKEIHEQFRTVNYIAILKNRAL